MYTNQGVVPLTGSDYAVVRFFKEIKVGDTYRIGYNGGYSLSNKLDVLKFKPSELSTAFAPLMLWTYAHSKDMPVGDIFITRIKMDYTDTMWCEKGVIYPILIGNEQRIDDFFKTNNGIFTIMPFINMVRTVIAGKHLCTLTTLGMEKDLQYLMFGAYTRMFEFFLHTFAKRFDNEFKTPVQMCFTEANILNNIFSFLRGTPIREKDLLSLIQTSNLDLDWRVNAGWIEVNHGKGKRKRWDKIKKISSYGGDYASDEEY